MDRAIRIKNKQRLLSFNLRKQQEEEIKENENKNNGNENVIFIAPKMTEDEEDPNATLFMQNGLLKHPFSMVMAGTSGSGKTNQLLWLMKDPNALKGYYKKDNIYFFSCTANCDKSFKNLDIKKKNICEKDFIENMDKLLDEIRNKKKKKGENMEPHLIICEDSTSDARFLRSDACRQLFVLLRHLNTSVIMCIHKMNALQNTSRYSCHYWLVFPTNRDQTEILYETFCPAGCDKKTFYNMVDRAYEIDDNDVCKRPFFFINNREPDIHKKFGRGFHKILKW